MMWWFVKKLPELPNLQTLAAETCLGKAFLPSLASPSKTEQVRDMMPAADPQEPPSQEFPHATFESFIQ